MSKAGILVGTVVLAIEEVQQNYRDRTNVTPEERTEAAGEVLEALVDTLGWRAVLTGLRTVTDSHHRNPTVHSTPDAEKACGALYDKLQGCVQHGELLDRLFAKLNLRRIPTPEALKWHNELMKDCAQIEDPLLSAEVKQIIDAAHENATVIDTDGRLDGDEDDDEDGGVHEWQNVYESTLENRVTDASPQARAWFKERNITP